MALPGPTYRDHRVGFFLPSIPVIRYIAEKETVDK